MEKPVNHESGALSLSWLWFQRAGPFLQQNQQGRGSRESDQWALAAGMRHIRLCSFTTKDESNRVNRGIQIVSTSFLVVVFVFIGRPSSNGTRMRKIGRDITITRTSSNSIQSGMRPSSISHRSRSMSSKGITNLWRRKMCPFELLVSNGIKKSPGRILRRLTPKKELLRCRMLAPTKSSSMKRKSTIVPNCLTMRSSNWILLRRKTRQCSKA